MSESIRVKRLTTATPTPQPVATLPPLPIRSGFRGRDPVKIYRSKTLPPQDTQIFLRNSPPKDQKQDSNDWAQNEELCRHGPMLPSGHLPISNN
jgi:hypothetical protein